MAVAAPAQAADSGVRLRRFRAGRHGGVGQPDRRPRGQDRGFANGTRLNLKRTDFEPGAIAFQMLVGDGLRAFPRDKPGLPVMLGVAIPEDGLDAHGPDELRRLLAGRRVSLGLGATDEALSPAARRRPPTSSCS